MKSRIDFQPAYSLLTIDLEPRERVQAEPGALVAKHNTELYTRAAASGVFKGIRRMIASESFFVNTFEGGENGGWVSLAPHAPGDINAYELHPMEPDIFIQAGAFLAHSSEVVIDTKFQGFKGLFSGEGLFFINASVPKQPGTLWYSSFGAIAEVQLRSAETVTVDTGHLVAFTAGVTYRVGKAGGITSLFTSGEGLVTHLEGPGSVWIQTRAIANLAERLTPLLKTT